MAFLGFENPIWLWSLLSLIPFILIYLIRPKPKEMEIPSLMFFIKSNFSEKERSFLRRFINDILFFIQLLVLIILSVHLASPYLNIKQTLLLDNSVIVLDNSASMRVNDDSYFKKAVNIAKDHLGGRNTLILVSNSPKLALKDADKDDALKFLNNLKPSDVRSNIGDAISFAGDYATGNNPVVFVISDFISTEGTNIDVAKNSLKTKGINVNLIDVKDKEKKNNVGIVDINPSEETTQIFIKNFNEREESVKTLINDLEKEITINPKSIEVFSFKTPSGITKIEILNKDDFMADNFGYVSKPAGDRIKVLLISNDESIYLKSALEASNDIILDTAKPPIIPEGDYDLYIVHNVNKKNLITGFFEKLKEKATGGASVAIHAQLDSNEINYGGLIPVELGKKEGFTNLEIEQINRFTKDVDFGSVRNYFNTKDVEGVTIVKAGESGIIVLNKIGRGKVVYYGILEDFSDFKLSPSYPVFWVNLVKFLADVSEMNDINLKTGEILIFDSKLNAKTPSKTVHGDIITLDEAGIYEVDEKIIAANLASERESNLNYFDDENKIEGLDKNSEESKIKQDITTVLLIIAVILLLTELLWTKMRGDL